MLQVYSMAFRYSMLFSGALGLELLAECCYANGAAGFAGSIHHHYSG